LVTIRHGVNQGVLTYIKHHMERNMTTIMHALLKCINLQSLCNNVHITKIITTFLGEKPMRLYVLMYTLCKPNPELCASHSSCYSEYNADQTKKMIERCHKFKSRGYNLLNMLPCGPMCRYTKNKDALKMLNFGYDDDED